MNTRRSSFEYEDLLACGRGELFQGGPQLPLPPMLMFDRISEIAEAGGEYGLDALWQMVGFFLGWTGSSGRGRAIGAGEIKLAGQVLPTVKELIYGIDIKRVMRSKLVLGIADGWLSADGEIVYRVGDLKVAIFKDSAPQPAGA
jgi:3-hydroxyacyl-[acyl-carrier protein] dehydratase/trans-2-decenoyl-[acyl-carrier protein] isomerase